MTNISYWSNEDDIYIEPMQSDCCTVQPGEEDSGFITGAVKGQRLTCTMIDLGLCLRTHPNPPTSSSTLWVTRQRLC
jgi:hypothetical protein